MICPRSTTIRRRLDCLAVTKGPTNDLLKDTIRLTGIHHDDPRSQTRQRPSAPTSPFVIQTDTSDSEHCGLNTGGAHVAKEHHERESNTIALVPRPQRNGHSQSKSAALSILRQEETGLLGQERGQGRGHTRHGRQRDTLSSLFAKQNI